MVGEDTVTVQSVPYGEAALAPNIPIPEGQKFISWTPSFEKVESDLVVEALFEKISVSSSSEVASNSSVVSSSSETNALQGIAAKSFSLHVADRSILLSNARVGDVFAIMDMQGRVMSQGRIHAETFSVAVPRSGSYMVRVGNQTKFVKVR